MRSLGLLLLCLLQFSCSSQNESKINGVSFVANPDRANQSHVNPVLDIGANYAAVMPFGFVRNLQDPGVIFDTDRQWFGETKVGAKQYIEILKKNGIQIMVKPQIWVWRGEFTGDLLMNSEDDWVKFENSYEKFILTYARLAQETNAEIYCIGTELEEFVKHRPEFWHKLIGEVRKIYSGQLTYAANWDEYKRTPFWEDMDFIGVDAYFPLSEMREPSVDDMKKGWQKWKTALKELSNTTDKPILFTEFGYRSMDYTAKKPWLVDRNEMAVNLQSQADALKVTFEEFWKEDWFAGGFVWKWFIHHEDSGGVEDNRFTPQNKPAQEVLKKAFSEFN
ncbi:glycoside hydrolase family 113 [Croceivirga thetidis]|uniref:Glycoside hydrolase n=1 Tax=Croceivirga thetidis TaxID=2721623 RepID=A0ABX1GP10_9FLAO|nr:glycoside hydrolase TIM-barrel-like domain-containing protein [Croceivirga thetidis]NKI31667.1 glycoside hydrolase [Croceivirga thetidis]